MSDLQVILDESEDLEREVQELWSDPALLQRELDTGSRELTRLRAEIRALDGPERHRASLFVTSLAIAAAAAVAIAGYVLGGGIL